MTIEDPEDPRIVHAIYTLGLRVTGCGEGTRWPTEWWVNKANEDPETRVITCLECADFVRRSGLEQLRGQRRRARRTRGRS